MMLYRIKSLAMPWFCLLVVVMLLTLGADPAAAATKRILLVGDSWAMSICTPNRDGFPSNPVFNDALAANGLGEYEVEGALTAWGGRQAAHWVQPANLATIVSELEAYPTIDIVHLIIGGNDFLNSAKNSDFHNAALRASIFSTIKANIQTIVNTALAVRPDIRVVIAGYDYLDVSLVGALLGTTFFGATQTEFNQWMTELGAEKLDIARNTDRCEYVQNWGTLQAKFSAPAGYPYPDGPPSFTNYPAGDITSPMPAAAHVGDGVHPTDAGHTYLLQNAIDQYYLPWLAPAEEPVNESLPVGEGAVAWGLPVLLLIAGGLLTLRAAKPRRAK